ncbi:MAG: hypothetical protein GY845_32420 [Planctomycetes bacterium]|nr:hypothetical protein [Planctomycetota bacterium]
MLDSHKVELILATAILILVVLGARRAFLAPTQTNSFDFALIFTGVFFGLGPWVAFIYGNWSFVHDNVHSPLEPVELLIKAYLVIVLYILGIWIIGKIFLPLKKHGSILPFSEEHFTITKFFDQYQTIKWQYVIIIIGFIWLLRMIVALRYDISFSGTATRERVLSQPYYIVVLSSLARTLAVGCLVWNSASFWSDKRFTKYVAACFLLLELFWMFLSGRRRILIWCIFVAFGYLSSCRRFNLKKLLLLLLTFGIVFQFLFPFFLKFRFHYYSTEQQQLNPVERIGKTAIKAFGKDNDVPASSIQNYSRNMSMRPLFLRRFICRICEGLDKKSPMMGRVLLRSFEYIIPSAFFPNKITRSPPEQMIQEHFGYPLKDTAITWPATGCADFGISGGLIAGMIVGLWIAFVSIGAKAILSRHPMLSLTLTGGMMLCLSQVESSLIQYWEFCRNMLMLLVMAEILSAFRILFICVTKQQHIKPKANKMD